MKRSMSVNDWEARQGAHRRYLTALVIPKHERANMLYDMGYSQQQIAVAVREVLRIKHRRKQTFNNLRFQLMEELMERTSRGLVKAVTLGMSGRKERRRLAQFVRKS